MLPIYIVSLKRDTKRRAIIQQKMDELSIPFKFIDAVMGKELSKETLENLRQKKSGTLSQRQYDATPGEIGCSLSHLYIYEMMQNLVDDWVCILEDDVILDERFTQFYLDFHNHSMDLNPNNLYLLGGQNGLEHPLVFKSIVRKFSIGQQKFTKTIKSQEYIYRTCCYLMSKSMAKNLIDLSETEFFIADDWKYLSQKNIIKDIFLSDFVAHPLDLSNSMIEEERLTGQKGIETVPLSVVHRIINGIKWRIKFIVFQILRCL